MRSLSIQGIDERLAVQLRQQAKKSRKSLNQFVLDTLKKHVGLEQEQKSAREYTDLDGLFGAWSEKGGVSNPLICNFFSVFGILFRHYETTH